MEGCRIPTEQFLPQGFSASALLTLGVRQFTVVGGCALHRRKFSSILGLSHQMPEAPLPNGYDNQQYVQTPLNVQDLEPVVGMNAVLLYFWLHFQLILEKTPPNTPLNCSSSFFSQLHPGGFLRW